MLLRSGIVLIYGSWHNTTDRDRSCNALCINKAKQRKKYKQLIRETTHLERGIVKERETSLSIKTFHIPLFTVVLHEKRDCQKGSYHWMKTASGCVVVEMYV